MKDLTFEAPSTGVLALVGRSGVGKSTLLALLAGLYLKDDAILDTLSGEVTIDGLDPTHIRGSAKVSWVPQSPTLLDHLTVMENILLPHAASVKRSPKVIPKHLRERVLQMLRGYGLAENCAELRPRELSGGMATRVALIRASITSPELLFLDEPFASLDLLNRWSLYRIINAERRKDKLLTMLTTHDVPEAVLIADYILALGSSETGTSIKVLQNEPSPLTAELKHETLARAREKAGDLEEDLFRN